MKEYAFIIHPDKIQFMFFKHTHFKTLILKNRLFFNFETNETS